MKNYTFDHMETAMVITERMTEVFATNQAEEGEELTGLRAALKSYEEHRENYGSAALRYDLAGVCIIIDQAYEELKEAGEPMDLWCWDFEWVPAILAGLGEGLMEATVEQVKAIHSTLEPSLKIIDK